MGDHLKNLRMVFELLHRYQLRMNPLKYAFGVTSEKFLGFIVRHRGMEIDQAKVDAILKMPESRDIHELKSLQRKLAYLKRFISNLAERYQPFSLFMKKGVPFKWDQACSNAFESIKSYLMKPPAVKGQALADFLADHPIPDDWELTDELPDEDTMVIEVQPPWKMYFDGAAQRGGAGASVVFVTSQGEVLPYSFTLTQLCSNNVAEYQALILGLEMAVKINRLQLQVFGNSQLVINQFLENPRRRTEIRRRAPRFLYYKDTLYKRSFEGVLLRCLGEERALQALQEAHSGICGSHQSGPKLHFHIKRLGYYWPTMPSDAWGLDVVGPLPKSFGVHLYILTATDYFSKWAEVVALKEQRNSSMYNAAANGLAEALKKTLCNLLKKVISKSKRDWNDRMEEALWAYRMTHHTPTQATPYSLVYGVKAILPLECQIPTLRLAIQEGIIDEENARLRLAEFEALDEKRLEAQQSLECYQDRLSRAFNKRVRPRSFQVGDQVLAGLEREDMEAKKPRDSGTYNGVRAPIVACRGRGYVIHPVYSTLPASSSITATPRSQVAHYAPPQSSAPPARGAFSG
ncbi:uncharacterized protein [Nicotiana tomentosiformis]|uniref:uncharacterized protein n=1 Tax=Nicotiana tomentosiformis TaxID=4098 RepID=UPI00388CC57D